MSGAIVPGARVYVIDPLAEIVLSTHLGTVVRDDPLMPDHVVVRLDKPARYWPDGYGRGQPRALREIREARDNLRWLPR